MRTVKCESVELNMKKLADMSKLCHAYAKEKNHWLDVLRNWSYHAQLGNHRKIRDHFVKLSYKSPNGLQARHWKLALVDAAETWDKYWQAIFVEVRSKISRRKDLQKEEKHYANWLLSGYVQFADLMQGLIPEPSFLINKEPRKRIAAYVQRTVKKLRGKQPSVKKQSSVKFDANCYTVFEHKDVQYLSLMSLEPKKRISIPLFGKTKIEGTITCILTNNQVRIHMSQELKQKKSHKETVQAIDFGYTEVMTDTTGKRFGTQFGKILTQSSDQLNEKMKSRNKLHAIQKKSQPQKAKNLRKYNLGRKKFSRKKKQVNQALECCINQAINEFINTKKPAIVVTEDLRHAFSYNKPKAVNRKMSSWLRGRLQDRISFKALAEGFRHEQVNPAYGSQLCPQCGYVDQLNRKGDEFKCCNCQHEDVADRVAAINYERRYIDGDIERYTPYREVKAILLEKFQRRLEAGKTATVPGRTLDTVGLLDPQASLNDVRFVTGREDKISEHQAVTQRAKQNEYVLLHF